ncbi:MAG: transposase, partial [Flavobacteriaceae bacterium]
MEGVNKWQFDFMIEIFTLFLSIKGRLNFLQFSRYTAHNEQRYRNQFSKSFGFLEFNKELVLEHASDHLTIAFDPSYVSKSGKATWGLGKYWSGVAGQAKWGLEISGIAAIDMDNHTAFHLEAVQTPNDLSESLLEHYAMAIVQRKEQLLCLSNYVVADAYFSKHGFVSALAQHGFETVSRLRDDAALQYNFVGSQKKTRGRPKKYDGKVDYKQLNGLYMKKIKSDLVSKLYQGVVFSKALKRDINLVVAYTKKKGKWKHKLYFSTDLELSAERLLEYYQTRFQIEFTFRDAKQHTGLNHCQARSENKLHFHFNTSLTAINIAKITHWMSIEKDKRPPFSMANIK